VKQLLKEIMGTQQELAADLAAVKQQLSDAGDEIDKIATETDTLLAKIVDLQKQIDAGNVSPELQAAFDAVKAQAGVVADKVKKVDEKVPDAT
jgi:uncharacterized coiled-coil DUF342 family protein